MTRSQENPIHIRQIHSDNTDTGTLCGNIGVGIKCFPYQVKHAVHSGGICDICVDFYTSHKDYFDNISPPWDQYDEAMAFGGDY